MGFGEKGGGFVAGLGEEHKAPTEGGTDVDPRYRQRKEKFKTVDDVVAEGLSPEDEAAENEERAKTAPDYSGTDSARLDIAEWQAEEDQRRERSRVDELRTGWSPRKGTVVREAPDELHSEAVRQMAAEKARFLRGKGQTKGPHGAGERPAQKPIGKPQADKRRAA